MTFHRMALAFLFVFLIVPHADAAGEKTLCSDLKPFQTRINITYETVPPVYDFSKTESELTQDAKKTTERWLKRHAMDVLWTSDDMNTAGLASGGWAMAGNHRMRSRKVDWMGTYHCAFFEEINLAVFYRTIIYIPKDYPKGTCKFRIVNKHELRHHKTNQTVVDKYVGKLKNDIRRMIPVMEGEYSGSHRIQERFESMKVGMTDAVKIYLHDAMSAEIEKLNSRIDTPEEYKNTGKLFHYCDLRDEYYRKKAMMDNSKESAGGK